MSSRRSQLFLLLLCRLIFNCSLCLSCASPPLPHSLPPLPPPPPWHPLMCDTPSYALCRLSKTAVSLFYHNAELFVSERSAVVSRRAVATSTSFVDSPIPICSSLLWRPSTSVCLSTSSFLSHSSSLRSSSFSSSSSSRRLSFLSSLSFSNTTVSPNSNTLCFPICRRNHYSSLAIPSPNLFELRRTISCQRLSTKTDQRGVQRDTESDERERRGGSDGRDDRRGGRRKTRESSDFGITNSLSNHSDSQPKDVLPIYDLPTADQGFPLWSAQRSQWLKSSLEFDDLLRYERLSKTRHVSVKSSWIRRRIDMMMKKKRKSPSAPPSYVRETELADETELLKVLIAVKRPFPQLSHPLPLSYVSKVAAKVWKKLEESVKEKEKIEAERLSSKPDRQQN